MTLAGLAVSELKSRDAEHVIRAVGRDVADVEARVDRLGDGGGSCRDFDRGRASSTLDPEGRPTVDRELRREAGVVGAVVFVGDVVVVVLADLDPAHRVVGEGCASHRAVLAPVGRPKTAVVPLLVFELALPEIAGVPVTTTSGNATSLAVTIAPAGAPSMPEQAVSPAGSAVTLSTMLPLLIGAAPFGGVNTHDVL